MTVLSKMAGRWGIEADGGIETPSDDDVVFASDDCGDGAEGSILMVARAALGLNPLSVSDVFSFFLFLRFLVVDRVESKVRGVLWYSRIGFTKSQSTSSTIVLSSGVTFGHGILKGVSRTFLNTTLVFLASARMPPEWTAAAPLLPPPPPDFACF